MFDLNTATGAITLSKGDTASWEIELARVDGVAFTEDDRAVFSLYRDGAPVMERIYTLDNEDDETLGNGVIRIELTNADTDQLDPATYSWEIRVAINAYFDTAGRVISGDGVDTPGIDGSGNTMAFNLKPVQYNI